LILDANTEKFPKNVIGISDIISIRRDLGNQIPDKSWMIYLLELFVDSPKKIPLELDLFSQFDNKNYFEAIFGGHNQYRFSNIVPQIGHSYHREIITNDNNKKIIYKLTDLNLGEQETFELTKGNVKHPTIDISKVNYIGSASFSGIEWWNKVDTTPFSVRFQVGILLLQYIVKLNSSKKYYPFSIFKSDVDPLCKSYPISFDNIHIINDCICYYVQPGKTLKGLIYKIN
jgi:hypothetical protein